MSVLVANDARNKAGPSVDDGRASGRRPTRGIPWQPALPPLRHVIRQTREQEFAHPAETDFSRILSYYRIRWVYEPTTFALSWAADGRPSEMFTPDFYLPDHRLYIELTTMQQRLVTRKNRKLRRLRELYPNVRIKLLYRRDYLRLLDAYPNPKRLPEPGAVDRILFSAEAIDERVDVLGQQIASDIAISDPSRDAAPVLAIGVGSGSRRFHGLLADAVQRSGACLETDTVRLTKYQTLGGARRVRVYRGPRAEIRGRRVLLVADIISTGLSLAYLANWLHRRGAAAVEVCTLLDRRETRLVEIPVRYAGFDAPAEPLAGFGLDRRRQFRDLPYIAVVKPA